MEAQTSQVVVGGTPGYHEVSGTGDTFLYLLSSE